METTKMLVSASIARMISADRYLQEATEKCSLERDSTYRNRI